MLYGVLAAGLLALGGCSPSAVDEPAGTDSSCRVAFRLGGAAGNASSRMVEGESASGGELQTNLEKQVNSLLAVIFTDADPSGDTEDNANDKFFRTVKIDLGGETDPVIEGLSFLVGDEGNYQVIFVANADTDLAGKINALEKDVSTVQTLKNLEVSQSPDTKPGMLMTSGFIRFRSSLVEAVDLGTVYLRRIMSRIDIINMAGGVTVTRAVLHNRTVKSLLCNDETLQVNEEYIGGTEEYTIVPALAGDMDNPTKYEAEIYSYEQLADNTQEDYQPSVDIYYTKQDADEKVFKHTVSLKVPESEDEGASLVPIGLKRNNAYLVYIRADAGELLFSVKVEDWVEGETFTVTDGELSEGAFGISTAPGTVTGSWTDGGTQTAIAY
ncbi:hypothetical protein [Phocaeicola plebeius]|uniref:hypothetical protein n=1 Tax=Phocaeicola plebeius TaxID=310297 RepID=UPI0026ECC8B6|nr:hypothetical protein [Phocaeicola plebeius]